MHVFPETWKLLHLFKLRCSSKGWKTSENYDWVFADEKYHTFVWTKIIYPSTFERILSIGKCIVKEGLYYRVVDAAYFAWLFKNPLPQSLLDKILSTNEILKKTAIYDLSEIYKGKNVCLRINKTDSQVFKEFEMFLKELGVKVVPFPHIASFKEGKRKKKLLVSGKA